MSIELVVLDMAGTTVRDDDAVNLCLQAALTGAGFGFSRDAVNEVMGIPKPVAIERLLAGRRGRPPAAAEVDGIHGDFLRRMIAHYEKSPEVGEIPGAGVVFRRLRDAGLKVALDTGFSRPIVDAILKRLGWTVPGVLDATVASDEVANGRPHPDLIFRAMEIAGVDSARSVAKVGDTPSDLEEGAAAGCGLVIGVTYGSHTRDQLEMHPHTRLIDSLKELPALVRTLTD